MTNYLIYTLLAVLSLADFTVYWQITFFPLSFQSSCLEDTVKGIEIITSQELDINQDGKLDKIILYGKDNVDIIVILDYSPEPCKIALEERVTALKLVNPVGWRTVQVRNIEMVELTGDDRPELHIWLEKVGAPSRYEHAVHIIYTFANEDKLRRVLNTEQCLRFSTFEFRDRLHEKIKDIYLDTDNQCEPPWSSQRTYTIMQWDGSSFIPSESGTINRLTVYPPWLNLFCIITIVSIGVLALVIIRLGKKKLGVAT